MARKKSGKPAEKPAEKPKENPKGFEVKDSRTFDKEGNPNSEAKDTPKEGVAKIENKKMTLDDMFVKTSLHEKRNLAMGMGRDLSTYTNTYFKDNADDLNFLRDQSKRKEFVTDFFYNALSMYTTGFYGLDEKEIGLAKGLIARELEDMEGLATEMASEGVNSDLKKVYRRVKKLKRELNEATGLDLKMLKERFVDDEDAKIDLEEMRKLVEDIENKYGSHIIEDNADMIGMMVNKDNIGEYRQQLMTLGEEAGIKLKSEDLAIPQQIANPRLLKQLAYRLEGLKADRYYK